MGGRAIMRTAGRFKQLNGIRQFSFTRQHRSVTVPARQFDRAHMGGTGLECMRRACQSIAKVSASPVWAVLAGFDQCQAAPLAPFALHTLPEFGGCYSAPIERKSLTC